MPYKVKGKCVYKKDTGAKVGCTKGPVEKYLAALHANANESISETNKLKGGLADKMSVEDIAKKFNVSVEKIKAQIKKGVEVEKEHTNDKDKATEIAMDHVSEFPDYYDRIEKTEKGAEKEWGKEINENEINGNMIIDFIKTLEDSKILAKDSHKNTKMIDTVTNIVSMPENDFYEYISKNPNRNVKMIRSEFNDWKKTYGKINETTKSLIKRLIRENLSL